MMAAADSGGRSGLGWVILVAALAVPGFLFYNWSSRLKAEHDRGISTKAHNRLEGGVFQTPPATARMINPLVASTAASAAMLMSTATAAAAKPAPAGAADPAPAAAQSAAPKAATPAPPMQGSPAAPASAGATAVSSAAVAAIMLPRDPMLSPLDIVHMREIEEERRRHEEELRLAALRGKRHVVRRERPIELDIELQGIVARPDGGNMAIINDEKIAPGASFSVASHSGRVKVISISSESVTFQYGSHRFKKVVGKD